MAAGVPGGCVWGGDCGGGVVLVEGVGRSTIMLIAEFRPNPKMKPKAMMPRMPSTLFGRLKLGKARNALNTLMTKEVSAVCV